MILLKTYPTNTIKGGMMNKINMFILNQNYKESEISNCVNPDNIYHKCIGIEIKECKLRQWKWNKITYVFKALSGIHKNKEYIKVIAKTDKIYQE